MARRREFPKDVYAQIVHRAMLPSGEIACEGCGLILGKKVYHVDHTIPDALFLDKSRRLTADDGKLLGAECCHAPKTKNRCRQHRRGQAPRGEALRHEDAPEAEDRIAAETAKAGSPDRKAPFAGEADLRGEGMSDPIRWRTRRTAVEVEIHEFDREQLLQGLIDDGCISETEALAILVRHGTKEKAKPVLERSSSIDVEELMDARDELARGRRDEALIHLERFLGRGYTGRLVS